MTEKKDIPNEVREYMSKLGKKGGARNKAKGVGYFKWVRSHKKDQPKDNEGSPKHNS